jgi:hypothetical protein
MICCNLLVRSYLPYLLLFFLLACFRILGLWGWCHFWRDPGCWPASVLNLPFLQPPGFESCSHWSNILPTTFWKPQRDQTTEPHCVTGPHSRALQPVGGSLWNWEVCTPGVILGSPFRLLKEAVKPRTRPSDWWSEMETCSRHLDHVGSPGVVSVRSWCRLILRRGPAEP